MQVAIPGPAAAQARVEPQAPVLTGSNQPVETGACVSAGTGLHRSVSYLVGALVLLALIAGTGGIILIALLIGPIIEAFRWKRVRASIRGSGIQVSPEQLPFIDEAVKEYATRLGMKKVPEVYVVEDSVQNGVAMKLGTKDIVMLTDDVVWGALQSRDPRALGFVIGHELGHIAMGHTGVIRSSLRTFYPPLSRCDEYTADNLATALIGDSKVAVHGLAILTIGPQLLPYVNDDALLAQAEEIWVDKAAKKAERKMHHPLLLKRIANATRRL